MNTKKLFVKVRKKRTCEVHPEATDGRTLMKKASLGQPQAPERGTARASSRQAVSAKQGLAQRGAPVDVERRSQRHEVGGNWQGQVAEHNQLVGLSCIAGSCEFPGSADGHLHGIENSVGVGVYGADLEVFVQVRRSHAGEQISEVEPVALR